MVLFALISGCTSFVIVLRAAVLYLVGDGSAKSARDIDAAVKKTLEKSGCQKQACK